jgi:carboxymethylenebutenolidase
MNTAQQYLVEEELEYYRDGWISRRDFLKRAAILGAGAATAATMAASVIPARRARAAPARQTSPDSVAPNDPAVTTDWISYRSTDGVELRAYLAWPTDAAMNASRPGVTVCHQNRGLQPQIQDVARRYAKQGYVAIAPDLPSRTGTATDDYPDLESLMAAYRQLTPEQNALDFAASLDYLRAHPAVDENKLAGTGFCFGGGVIWRLATIYPALTAAAPYYGSNPPLDAVPDIKAAMFGVYPSTDDRLNAGLSAITEAMHQAGTRFKITVYPNSDHGFYDDTGNVYNPQTAPQSFRDTLRWFAEHLRLPEPTI